MKEVLMTLLVCAAAVGIIFAITTASTRAQEIGKEVKISCVEAGGTWIEYQGWCIGGGTK